MAHAPMGLDLLLGTVRTAKEKFELLCETGCLNASGLSQREALIAMMAQRLAPARSGFGELGPTDDQWIAGQLAIRNVLSNRGRTLASIDSDQYRAWDAAGRGKLPKADQHGEPLPGCERQHWWQFWRPRARWQTK